MQIKTNLCKISILELKEEILCKINEVSHEEMTN